MEGSIILTNSGTLILTIVAMFAVIISWFVSNRTLSAVLSVGSFLGVLACITYALLLGASLTEVLILVLVFVALNLFCFLSKPENKENINNDVEASDKQEDPIKEEEDDK